MRYFDETEKRLQLEYHLYHFYSMGGDDFKGFNKEDCKLNFLTRLRIRLNLRHHNKFLKSIDLKLKSGDEISRDEKIRFYWAKGFLNMVKLIRSINNDPYDRRTQERLDTKGYNSYWMYQSYIDHNPKK
ncbi:hypothetical protein GOV12_00065 [Candidatus Pacearchaeota archaeon]|nr:hypothetical protein [Candidatus Pacearchaeota archaeon]